MFFESRARMLKPWRLCAVAVLLTLVIGCGHSSNDYVATGSVPGSGAGSLTFNFVKPQRALEVPTSTTQIGFRFFSEANGQGNETHQAREEFAPIITLTNVPVSTRSVVITAYAASGAPIGNVTVPIQVISDSNVVVNLDQFSLQPISLTSLEIVPSTITLEPGQVQQLLAEATFTNGETLAILVEWDSDDDSKALVSSTGLVTAVAAGEVEVTATFDTTIATATVTVSLPTPLTSDRESHAVEISASTASVVEGSSLNDAFLIQLSQPAPVGGLVVQLTIAGTADQTTDYTSPLASGVTTVTVPEGNSQLAVALVTVDRAGVQPSRTVSLTLNETSDYGVGPQGEAIIVITDDDTLAVVPTANQVVNRRTSETFNGATAITDAINDADTISQDILDVGPGTYNGFQAFKELTIYGPNAGIAPTGTRNAEAVVTTDILVSAAMNGRASVTLDGFDLQTVQSTAVGSPAEVQMIVRNSIFDNGLAGGSYISAFNVPETELKIENNSFSGLTASASAMSCFLTNPDPTVHDIQITGNSIEGTISDDQRGFQFNNCGNVLVEGNTFQNLGRQGIAIAGSIGPGSNHNLLNNQFTNVNVQGMGQADQRGAIRLSDTNVLAGPIFVQGNKIGGANAFGGIAISASGGGGGNFATSNFFFNFNNLTPGNGPGFFNPGPAPTGTIDLTQNWWGTPTPTDGNEIQGDAGITGLVIDPTLSGPIE